MPQDANNLVAHNQATHTPEEHHAGKEVWPPLHWALFRVMRSLMFDDRPLPGLDSLPLAQLRLLWAIRFGGDAPMKEFSEKLQVSQSTVTQLADKLVRRGLVERHADPLDRRVSRLQLSESGRLLLDEAEAQRRGVVWAVWDELPEIEQVEVMRGLEILGHAAEEVRRKQGRPVNPWPPQHSPPRENEETSAPQSQPVVDLMNRRVRGQ